MLVLIHNVTNELQFIPARGRKLVRIHCHIQLVPIVTYPRKGTETAFHEYKH